LPKVFSLIIDLFFLFLKNNNRISKDSPILTNTNTRTLASIQSQKWTRGVVPFVIDRGANFSTSKIF